MSQNQKVDELVQQNPKVDAKRLAETLATLDSLESINVDGGDYRLLLPFTRHPRPPFAKARLSGTRPK